MDMAMITHQNHQCQDKLISISLSHQISHTQDIDFLTKGEISRLIFQIKHLSRLTPEALKWKITNPDCDTEGKLLSVVHATCTSV